MRAGDENEEDSTLEFNPSSSAAFMKFNWIASHTVGGEIVDLDKTKIELPSFYVFSDVYLMFVMWNSKSCIIQIETIDK